VNTPKVSVTIPTYNQAGFILRSIRSALDQDYPNVEVVVSDDGSTDQTGQVVRDFIAALGETRVSYHRNDPNLGILRNYHQNLFHNATGDWAVNLDADDFFTDDSFLSRAMAAVAADPAIALVFADYCEINDATGRRLDIRNGAHPAVMSDVEFLDRFADSRIVWNHNSIVFDRHRAMEFGCYWEEGVPRNDWESFFRLVMGRKVAFLDGVVAAWVQHGANETKNADLAKYRENFPMIDGVAAHAAAVGLNAGFIRSWRDRVKASTTRASMVAYIRARDYRGLAAFLRYVQGQVPGLPLRLLREPSFLARATLAANPRLYGAVKRLTRRNTLPPKRSIPASGGLDQRL
jgi:glycosyltransferase involved in cell wall biosynthesis